MNGIISKNFVQNELHELTVLLLFIVLCYLVFFVLLTLFYASLGTASRMSRFLLSDDSHIEGGTVMDETVSHSTCTF